MIPGPQYEAGMFSTRQRRSISRLYNISCDYDIDMTDGRTDSATTRVASIRMVARSSFGRNADYYGCSFRRTSLPPKDCWDSDCCLLKRMEAPFRCMLTTRTDTARLRKLRSRQLAKISGREQDWKLYKDIWLKRYEVTDTQVSKWKLVRDDKTKTTAVNPEMRFLHKVNKTWPCTTEPLNRCFLMMIIIIIEFL